MAFLPAPFMIIFFSSADQQLEIRIGREKQRKKKAQNTKKPNKQIRNVNHKESNKGAIVKKRFAKSPVSFPHPDSMQMYLYFQFTLQILSTPLEMYL